MTFGLPEFALDNAEDNMRFARVFISCGQRGDREKDIGLAVEKHFSSRGFETYFAEKVHSSDALSENIFSYLKKSEYFVWIDFKRERLDNNDFRGSLFVNQELAIATFLKLEVIGFVEEGVRREGIANYHIYNPKPFVDGSQIILSLERMTKDWDKDSVNELAINYDPSNISKKSWVKYNNEEAFADFYSLEILNRNKKEHARSCLGYVTRIKNLHNGKELPSLPTVELNWSGLGDWKANIMAGTARGLDAFYTPYNAKKVVFHHRPLFTKNEQYYLPQLDPGHFRIEYTVMSANFESVAAQFDLEYGGTPDSVQFSQMS